MESKKLPFEITPQIRRYLEEMVDFNNEFFAQDLGEIYALESYLGNEKPTFKKEESHNNFWEYLQEKRIIKMVSEPIAKTVYYSDQSFGVIVPFQYKFKILDIKPIEELLEKIGISEENLQCQEKDRKGKVQSVKLPPDTKWQDINIRFIDNGDNMEISTKKISRVANYQEMGFEDTRQKRPNLQWKFLQLLAEQKGEIRWETTLDTSIKERNRFKKRVQDLSDTLKNYFQIKEQPFYSYRKEKAYKIKINLIKSSDNQESVRQCEDKDDIDPEVKEYLAKNAPDVYEKHEDYDNNY